MMMKAKRIPRLGIGGPVGSGKTMLIEKIVPILAAKGYKVGIISFQEKTPIGCVTIWQRNRAFFQKT
jgi:Ni2+-binding GTPase involved in maturation of urease and hydrogenase